MARFYQCLMTNPKGVWDEDWLHRVKTDVRNHFPDLMGTPVERTLGLCTAGGDGKAGLRGFGKGCSPLAFGHAGAGGQLNWADPAKGLSLSYLTNGLDANAFRQARRDVAIGSTAIDCVA
jgi:CubicO group peptidase (beta-lactamase class C family)